MDIHANKVTVEDLDFEVNSKPLQAICGTQIVTSQKHQGIHSDDMLLGVKPYKNIDIVNHLKSHQIGVGLYSKLFGEASSKACFLSEDKSWMASLIGKEKNPYEASNYNNTIAETCEVWPSYQYQFPIYQELTEIGFTPSIGVVNGFDFNDSLGYYLLVEPNSHSTDILPVLTLASFKVEAKHFKESKEYGDNTKEAILQLLLCRAVPKFNEELDAFNNLYNKLSNWPLDKKSLIAISLDLYNKNRNAASINADVLLSKELGRFIDNAELHFTGKHTLASIINFIIRYNEFDFSQTAYLRRNVEQLFVRKKSYQKMTRIFDKFTEPSSDFEGYQYEQLRAFYSTQEALQSSLTI